MWVRANTRINRCVEVRVLLAFTSAWPPARNELRLWVQWGHWFKLVGEKGTPIPVYLSPNWGHVVVYYVGFRDLENLFSSHTQLIFDCLVLIASKRKKCGERLLVLNIRWWRLCCASPFVPSVGPKQSLVISKTINPKPFNFPSYIIRPRCKERGDGALSDGNAPLCLRASWRCNWKEVPFTPGGLSDQRSYWLLYFLSLPSCLGF